MRICSCVGATNGVYDGEVHHGAARLYNDSSRREWGSDLSRYAVTHGLRLEEVLTSGYANGLPLCYSGAMLGCHV